MPQGDRTVVAMEAAADAIRGSQTKKRKVDLKTDLAFFDQSAEDYFQQYNPAVVPIVTALGPDYSTLRTVVQATAEEVERLPFSKPLQRDFLQQCRGLAGRLKKLYQHPLPK